MHRTQPPADATNDRYDRHVATGARSPAESPVGLRPHRVGATEVAAPLWPFRLAALAGAIVRAAPDLSAQHWEIGVTTAIAAFATLLACLRPAPYRDEPAVRLRVLSEAMLATIAVVLTGGWNSPFTLFLIPTVMLTGFAIGTTYASVLSLTAVVPSTLPEIAREDLATGLRNGALWTGLLMMVAFTAGLANRASREAARRQLEALDRVSKLSEANSLLFALQRVAQTLPASLDLDEVLDSTMARLRTLVRSDHATLFLLDPVSGHLLAARSTGEGSPPSGSTAVMTLGLRSALTGPNTARLDVFDAGQGVAPTARAGVYATLRARGAMVGMLAIENDTPASFGTQHAELVHGLAEPLGIAIDNARLFHGIRTLAADEERNRIARELHDHLGSSLATIGFELDRVISLAASSADLTAELRELRQVVSAAIGDARESLFDLRTEVTDRSDLAQTVAAFLERVEHRSGITTSCEVRLPQRPPRTVEREVWQIVREAVLNAERHAEANTIAVSIVRSADGLHVRVVDDGVGVGDGPTRSDSYGLLGMSERAAHLGAQLHVARAAGGGTEVVLDLPDQVPNGAGR